MYWAKCKQSKSHTVLQLYVHVSDHGIICPLVVMVMWFTCLLECSCNMRLKAEQYSGRQANATRQPSETFLKNTFKLVRNSQNWFSRYIWILTTELRSNMTPVTSISKVIRVNWSGTTSITFYLMPPYILFYYSSGL